MNPHRPSTTKRNDRGYTLVESLVASLVLMIGISAASQLTLTLLTQDEINHRNAEALNYLENASQLYQLGLDRNEVMKVLPDSDVVQGLTITTGTATIADLGVIENATVEVQYLPTPSSESWTGNTFTGGDVDELRIEQLVIYRSTLSTEIP